MDAGLFAIFVICLVALLAILGFARLVNVIAGRPLVNGGAIYFWLLLAAIVGVLGYQWSLPHVTERMAYYAGKSVAVLAPLLVLAFYLGRRFRSQRAARLAPTEVADV